MLRVLYLHFDSPDRQAKAEEIERFGCQVTVAEPVWPDVKAVVQKTRPAAIIFDAAVKPQQVRECARHLGENHQTHTMPHLIINVVPEDWAVTRDRARWAEMIARSRLLDRLSRIKS